jgi:enoyl-CoA hydratase
MVRAIGATLARWREDAAVAAVLVKAAPGRAFCAGGDVRRVVELWQSSGVEAALPFFHDEYRMNWRIKRFPKPYVALLDGVTMGGGVGLSVHGTHRIATENMLFAMPETGIGFFPDVGGTYFLPRLPGAIGMWLALTGARLGGADCHAAGIATHFVPRERLGELEERLVAAPAAGLPDVLDRLLRELASAPADDGELVRHRATIDRCFAVDELGAILAALSDAPGDWAGAQREVILGKSPLATRVTFAQQRRGRTLDFEAAMRLEYRLVRRMLESGEFFEGVRALLIDKDRRPRWRHRSLEEVTDEEVEAMFVPFGGGELTFDWRV